MCTQEPQAGKHVTEVLQHASMPEPSHCEVLWPISDGSVARKPHLAHPATRLRAYCLVPQQAAPPTCRLSPTAPATPALRAMTLLTGFISAESAVMGLFMGVMGEAMSTMTTLQHNKQLALTTSGWLQRSISCRGQH